jgi:hypothetical protein
MRRNGRGEDGTTVAEDAEAIRETDAALLVRMDDGAERWFPKSVIHDDSTVYEVGHTGELVVKRWFAIEGKERTRWTKRWHRSGHRRARR